MTSHSDKQHDVPQGIEGFETQEGVGAEGAPMAPWPGEEPSAKETWWGQKSV